MLACLVERITADAAANAVNLVLMLLDEILHSRTMIILVDRINCPWRCGAADVFHPWPRRGGITGKRGRHVEDRLDDLIFGTKCFLLGYRKSRGQSEWPSDPSGSGKKMIRSQYRRWTQLKLNCTM